MLEEYDRADPWDCALAERKFPNLRRKPMALDNAARISAETITALRAALGEHDEDAALRIDMIEAETDALELLSSLLKAYREETANGAAQRQLAALYRDRATASDKRIGRIRDAVAIVAEATGLDKIQRPEGTVHRRTNPPKVHVTDLAALADGWPELVKTEVKPLLKEIGDRLKGGETFEGAMLSNGEQTWGIR